MTTPSNRKKLQELFAPPVGAGEALYRATRWSLVGFALYFAVIFAGAWVWSELSGSMFSPAASAFRAALWAGLGGLATHIGVTLWLSRTALARAFSIFALAATFSGLMVLVVFFVSLLIDGRRYFVVTQEQLEKRNQELLGKFGSEEEAEKMRRFNTLIQEAFADFRRDYATLIDAETKGREPAKLQDLYRIISITHAEELAPFTQRLSDIALRARAEGILPGRTEQELYDRVEKDLERDTRPLIERELAASAAVVAGLDPLADAAAVAAVLVASQLEQEEIRRDYVELRAEKISDLTKTLAEDVLEYEHDYVKDTSYPALLWRFLSTGPAKEAKDAGVMPAVLGSIYLALIVVIAAVPLGVGAAVYLEEYRSRGWLPNLIQTNINNLAGIPSVVYGIFGTFVFVELIFKPLKAAEYNLEARNVLGGGLTLALLTLPVVIVSAQEAIRAVPVSIRHGALALGASRWQVVAHHVLPNALPGILTGTILAMSRAIGEAAPLVFFGALLYKADPPTLFSDFTVLPMQIFGWTSREELDPDFRLNAAMASLVLMVTLLALNAVAIFLRQRGQASMKW